MKAMILAAGRCERMRPLTDYNPKPLLQVRGKPLIVWHVERLVRAGICDLVINHAYLGEQIEQALGNGTQFGATIHYSPESVALETAGGIANALPLLGEEVFAVINGDIFSDYDFANLFIHAASLSASKDLAHLCLVNNPTQHPLGDFALQDGRITERLPKLTFSGIGLYKSALFVDISRGDKAALAPLLRQQIALNKVSGEHHIGLWTDVGTPERLEQLNQQLSQKNV